MINHIVIREIQDHLFKLRFLLLGSALILLFVFASLAFISDYRAKTDNYETPLQLLTPELSDIFRPENVANLQMFVQRPITVNLSPQPLWFFANGNNEALPNYFSVGNQNFQEVKSEIKRKNVNPWIKSFGSLDWIYIIGILGSFIAIALTYDAFTGEKEDGTLRLLLSNDVPRYRVLIGKFLGAFLALFIPLVIGQIVSLIILNVSGSINLGIYDYQKIAGIVVLSWMYLTVFIFIGLFISSLTHNSSSSLIILLFIWIVTTVIIPGSSSIFARSIYKIPSWEVFYKQANNDSQAATTSENLSRLEMAKIQYEDNRLYGEISAEYRNKKFEQVDIARAFARMSPMGTLTYAAEALAGVGLVRQKHLINQMLAYKNRLGEYILSEERRLSDDPKGILISTTLPRKPIDVDTVPVFQEQSMTIREGFETALLDMAILILYGFVFFACAYVSFNRYDVR